MPSSIQSAGYAFLRGSLTKTWSLMDKKLTFYWGQAGCG